MNAFDYAVLSDLRSRSTLRAVIQLGGRAKRSADEMVRLGLVSFSVESGYQILQPGRDALTAYCSKPLQMRGIKGAGGMI